MFGNHSVQRSHFVFLVSWFITSFSTFSYAEAAQQGTTASSINDEVIVVANRDESPLSESSSVSVINQSERALDMAMHPNEWLDQIPSVWLSRGNGQESLLSIRSPIFTGPGSCSEFLVMEQGVSTRAPGFCNVNQFFDIHVTPFSQLESLAGTASSLYGPNAIHGVINNQTVNTEEQMLATVALDSNQYQMLTLSNAVQSNQYSNYLSAQVKRSIGVKESSGFLQGKVTAGNKGQIGHWNYHTHIVHSNIKQDTAGYYIGEKSDYQIKDNRTVNLFPEAYRNANSTLFKIDFDEVTDGNKLKVSPYGRFNEMEFLMHFLPGQPIEKNGHESIGVQSSYEFGSTGSRTRLGYDLDYTAGYLKQNQEQSTNTGIAFLDTVLPVGDHYDFKVKALQQGIYIQQDFALSDLTKLKLSGRKDWIYYDYTNNLSDGNLTDQGMPCGFGGCRYTRPADREDNFSFLSTGFELQHRITNQLRGFIKWHSGFRAPHTSELYRLQNEQSFSDIDSQSAVQTSIGVSHFSKNSYTRLEVYLLEKQNVIYQNSDRQYTDNASTKHLGSELQLTYSISDQFEFDAVAQWAEHTYENSPNLFADSNITGNLIDTAPNLTGRLAVNYLPTNNSKLFTEWVAIGPHYLEPTNQHRYPGHSLINLGYSYTLNANQRILVSVKNVMDTAYAERADFAFGDYRYFIGEPRSVGLQYSVSFE